MPLEVACLNALAGSFHVRPCVSAGRSLLEDFLHRRPIGLGPATAVTLVAVSRHADLSKVEPGAAINFVELKNRDGIVIGRPVESPPGLNDPAPRPKCKIEA